MIWILLGVCAILLWIYLNKSDSTEPPMLSGKLPFIGHALKLLGSGVDRFNGIKKLSSECESLGGVGSLFLGPKKFYIITGPEDCLTLLNECTEKHYIYSFLKPALVNGTLVSNGPQWKKSRKLLNHAFSQTMLDRFIGIFNYHANILVEKFEKELEKPFDHTKYTKINNLKMICATTYGAKAEEITNLEKYLNLVEESLEMFISRILKFWYHSDFLFNLSLMKKRERRLAAQINNYADLIIQNRQAERMQCKDNTESKLGNMKSFMDLILELADTNPSVTDQQIRSEINTIVIAGQVTIGNMLTFAFTVLGSHPRVQEKAYQEIIEVLGETKRYINKEDLSKFVYIEVILKEILRLYPTVAVVARQTTKDVKLKNYTLKAGYGCLISYYGTLRHPMWGRDANEFRPERWLEKDSLPPLRYYSAFGLGRRNCIGQVYAMMSMKIILINVIKRYLITSDVNNMIIQMKTLIEPDHGFHIALKQR